MFKENCGKHLAEVISLQEYQNLLQKLLEEHISQLQALGQELKSQIDFMGNESSTLMTKKEKNQQTKDSISEFCLKMQEIMNLESNQNMFLSSSKLEQLIEIEKRFNENFARVAIEKNERPQLEKKLADAEKLVTELKENQTSFTQKLKMVSSKFKNWMEGNQSQKPRVAFIGLDFRSGKDTQVHAMLRTKNNILKSDIDIVYSFESRTTSNFQNQVQSLSLSNVDSFLIASNDPFPDWLGNYLRSALEAGKGDNSFFFLVHVNIDLSFFLK